MNTITPSDAKLLKAACEAMVAELGKELTRERAKHYASAIEYQIAAYERLAEQIGDEL